MQGLMQDHPLSLEHFFDRAENLFHDKHVVTATATPSGTGVSAVRFRILHAAPHLTAVVGHARRCSRRLHRRLGEVRNVVGRFNAPRRAG